MNPKAIRFTTEQREELRSAAVKAYTDGATIAETAEVIGCSSGTARNFLIEAGVHLRPRNFHRIELPEGMLTSPEAAALIGVGHASFNTMRNKGYAPPQAERPEGAHGNYTYYWRSDVEQWMKARAERRSERLQRTARNRKLRTTRAAFKHAPNWSALLADVDAKRRSDGLTWDAVCRLTALDPGQMSRLRKGTVDKGWGSFFRILAWLEGEMPEPIRKYVTEIPTEPAA